MRYCLCPQAVRRTSCRPMPLGRRHSCASKVSPPRRRSTSMPVTARRSPSSPCRRALMPRTWPPNSSSRPPRTAPACRISSRAPRTPAGPAPTVLYGYGGFEISLTPSYSANFGMLWLAKGGVYRGRQHPWRRRIRAGLASGGAAREAPEGLRRFPGGRADLVKRGITTPRQLGIMGGSNGGLLVSASMVQAPELFGAVVCQVPLIDMIRYTQIGAGASWAAEYGDPARAADRAWILQLLARTRMSAHSGAIRRCCLSPRPATTA